MRGTKVSSIPGLRQLWAETTGDPRICVAILDGPVDLRHPDLLGANVKQLVPFGSSANASGPAAEHGTHVARLIFGRHNGLPRGIAPSCSGLAFSVFNDGADGSVISCSQVDLARAISEAIYGAEKEQAQALVINISGGQLTPSGQAHPLLVDVIRKCDKEKVLIVAATGNDGCECLHVPAAIPYVLAVGAMDDEGHPKDFGNWGSIYRDQGVLAPADAGTSFATPIVSGVAALLLSTQLKRGMRPSARKVRTAILETARQCDYQQVPDCRRLLAGRLHIPGAMSVIIQRVTTMNVSGEQEKTSEVTGSTHVEGAVENTGNPAVSLDASRLQESQEVMPSASSCEQKTVAADGSGFGRSQEVMPSACSCESNAGGPRIVYALGKLTFDYGTRARRAYFASSFLDQNQTGSIDNPRDLIKYLTRHTDGPHYMLFSDPKRYVNRSDIASIIWTLSIDDTPIYAIAPTGPFGLDMYDAFVEFLEDQVKEQHQIDQLNAALAAIADQPTESQPNVDTSQIILETGRISVAGVINGQVKLYTGETVPVITPDPRGLRNWTLQALIGKAVGTSPSDAQVMHNVADFLNTAYSQTRNLGVAPQDRALNYAATDALVQYRIFKDVSKNPRFSNLEFDSFEVARSPICRPDADCWDVKLYFYDPNNLQRARRVVSYIIDVSDTLPVVLGRKQEYSTR